MLIQQYYTPCTTSSLYKLNLNLNFGSGSYQLSLHLQHCHEKGLCIRSTVPLVSNEVRLFEGHFHYLTPTEEDGHCRRLIHSTGFGRGGQPADDEETLLNRRRQDRADANPARGEKLRFWSQCSDRLFIQGTSIDYWLREYNTLHHRNRWTWQDFSDSKLALVLFLLSCRIVFFPSSMSTLY